MRRINHPDHSHSVNFFSAVQQALLGDVPEPTSPFRPSIELRVPGNRLPSFCHHTDDLIVGNQFVSDKLDTPGLHGTLQLGQLLTDGIQQLYCSGSRADGTISENLTIQ